MQSLSVCRVCLVMDVKMLNLQSYPLSMYFEHIMNANSLYETQLPLYLCYECAAMMCKFYKFKDKCLKGQAALYSIIEANGMITDENIKHLDRQQLKLKSNITTCPQEVSAKYVYENEDCTKYELLCDTINLNGVNDCVKEEVVFDDVLSPMAVQSDDDVNDDEPLILHKSNRDRKSKKRKKKTKKEKKSTEVPLEHYIELIPKEEEIELAENSKLRDQLTETTETAVVKRKRGRPRKGDKVHKEAKVGKRKKPENSGIEDQDNVEDFCTIINLSMEEQIAEVTKRKKSSNYLNSEFKCDQCYKGFLDLLTWKNHVAKHEPGAGEMICKVCKFRFRNIRCLKKHVAIHEKKYSCKSCPYVSKTKTQATHHHRWHKGYTYPCQYCDEVSTKWTSYLSHVRIKHPSQFICGACGYSFVSQLGLAMHKTMMHRDVKENEFESGVEEELYCKMCDVRFLSEQAFKRHLVMSVKHTQLKDALHGCRLCGEKFNSNEALKLHHRQEHYKKRHSNTKKQTTTWPINCVQCSAEIQNAREYWSHFRKMHRGKAYPTPKNHMCDICGKGFRSNAFLVYHRRTHSEERAFECHMCAKAFHNRTNLQVHIKTHSDSRPYPCDLCCKAFKVKSALDRHYRCHTGIKPYECEMCGKSFGQSNTRKLHIRTVHLKQPAPYVSRNRMLKKAKEETANIFHVPIY